MRTNDFCVSRSRNNYVLHQAINLPETLQAPCYRYPY